MSRKKISIKRNPDDTQTFKVNGGERIKLYLNARGVPPDYIPAETAWSCGYLRKTGDGNFRAVLLEVPGCFCGEDITVKFEYKTKHLRQRENFSMIAAPHENTLLKEPVMEELATEESVTRTFRPYCDVRFLAAHLCYPNTVEIPMQEGFYHIRRSEAVIITFELEGLNEKTIKASLQYKGGVYKTTAQVHRNKLSIPFTFGYDRLAEESIEDKLTVAIAASANGRDIGQTFKLKVYNHRVFRKEEIEAYNQVVVVGSQIQIAENNYHPCKYTDLEIREKTENKCVFRKVVEESADFLEQSFEVDWRVLEEAKYTQSALYTEAGSNSVKPFTIVSGEQEKNILVLAKDFNTDKCTTKTHEKVATLEGGHDPLKDTVKKLVRKESGLWETEMPVKYEYGLGAKTGMFAPLNLFFPFRNPQKRTLVVASCRRTLKIPVHIYPDIQWAVAVHFSVGKNIKADSFKGLFNLKKEEVADSGKNSLKFSLSTSWNNSSGDAKKKYSIYINYNDLSESIRKGDGWEVLGDFLKNQFYYKIKALYDAVLQAFSFLDLFDQVMKVVQYLEDKRGNQLKLSAARKKREFKITPPKVDLAFTWRAGAYNGNGGFIIEGSAKGQLIGLEARFDMFALAGKMPQLRLAVLALDIIEYFSNLKFRFDLVVTGGVELSGSIGYDDPREIVQTSLTAKGRVKLALELSAKVTATENNRLVTKEYGVKAEAGIELIYTFVPKNDGLYSPLEVAFTGLTGSIYCKITVRKFSAGKATDDNSNPFEEKTEIITTKTFIDRFSIYKSEEKSLNADKII